MNKAAGGILLVWGCGIRLTPIKCLQHDITYAQLCWLLIWFVRIVCPEQYGRDEYWLHLHVYSVQMSYWMNMWCLIHQGFIDREAWSLRQSTSRRNFTYFLFTFNTSFEPCFHSELVVFCRSFSWQYLMMPKWFKPSGINYQNWRELWSKSKLVFLRTFKDES